ncbi:hypothetical protein [Paraburkholderia sp. BL9I2N2]|uniref:hypothetical protein n=1 Tax=Paraburkholderia sp. BL9I2N2 TaxID=1938809 RepID=UPI0010439908|nr:hypothetical protein [Paraburkholderia sp. BL9I2N2]TCK96993.1 hypothetical protein B0G74_3694 [Paraburkholderia sp. BL9I2N2]
MNIPNKVEDSAIAPTPISPSWINERIICSELHLGEDWVLRLDKLDVEGGGVWEADIRELLLPPNQITQQVISFAEHVEYAAILVATVDHYLSHSSRDTHSRARQATLIVREIVLFLEFLWLRNCLSLRTATEKVFEEFASTLASGGHIDALRIEERIASLEDGASMENGLVAKRLGTNLVHFNGQLKAKSDASKKKTSSSALKITFLHINRFCEIIPELKISFRPYPRPSILADRLGKPRQSTRNLPQQVVGRLLRVSFLWLYERGPLLHSLLEEIIDLYEKNAESGYKWVGHNVREVLFASRNLAVLNKLLPRPINRLSHSQHHTDSSSISLRDAIDCFMASCAILISLFNARRPGEITHPIVGLQTGNLRVVDISLELAVVSFYLEKGAKKRVPFFVNATTKDAIASLEDLQLQLERLDSQGQNDSSIFCTRTFNRKNGLNSKTRFSFRESTRGRRDVDFSVVVEALGANVEFGGLRTFRRMHAVMHFYRYENGDIQALSFQMGHDALTTTVGYVGDSLSRPDFQSIFDISPDEVEELKRAALADLDDRHKDLEEVGYGKLMEEILIVLNNGRVSGGYKKIIKRLALKVAGSAKFHGGTDEKAQAVFQAVKARGHFPKPMKHGECMIGGAVKIKSARCYSRSEGRLCPENASPMICDNCNFHQAKPAYIRNLTDDRVRMERRLADDCLTAFERKRLETELKNLTQGIELMRARFEINL